MNFFCSPYGPHPLPLIDNLSIAGLKYAFCIDEGDYDCLDDNPYLIKRYDVNEFFKNRV
jgi:hypothetical protein